MKKQAVSILMLGLSVSLLTSTLSNAMPSFRGELNREQIKNNRLELVNKEYNEYLKYIENKKRKEDEEKQRLLKQKQLEEQKKREREKKSKAKINQWKTAKFKTTFYCGCSICNGQWTGQPTKSGVYPQAGRTIAVDPNIIPLGTEVYIDGKKHIAEDTGSAIKGYIIDYYVDSHEEALKLGVKYKTLKWK